MLNTYLSETRRVEHPDGLGALPLFLSLRAAIRAKVTAARLQTVPEKHGVIASQAQAYFNLARRVIAPAKSVLIAIGGLSGTGKTRLASALAPRLAPAPGAVLLHSDTERKVLCQIEETARLPAEAYAPAMTDRIYEILLEKAARAIRAGHSAVVDAVFARPDQRARIEALGRAEGIRFVGLFLQADLATRLARVEQRVGDASDADGAIACLQETYKLGSLTWEGIDASETPAQTLRQALALLKCAGKVLRLASSSS